MLEIFNNPSIGMPVMLSAIAAMNYYIRKHQLVRIQEYYEKMVQEQERRTQMITCELLADIGLS